MTEIRLADQRGRNRNPPPIRTSRRNVTEAEWASIRPGFVDGVPLDELGDRIGVTGSAVQRHFAGLGLRRYRPGQGPPQPRIWRCDEHHRTCTPTERCACLQFWERDAEAI